jgi:hypothetical protein
MTILKGLYSFVVEPHHTQVIHRHTLISCHESKTIMFYPPGCCEVAGIVDSRDYDERSEDYERISVFCAESLRLHGLAAS